MQHWNLCPLIIAVVYTTLYAIVSRLPMIFAMVHMVVNLELDGWVPAVIFCGYCVGRLLGAKLTADLFGMPALVLGTFSGVIGYFGIWIMPSNSVAFGVMLCLTGFTETVTGIDGLLKIEALVGDMSPSSEQLLFRTHLVAATVGSFIAYLGGGFVFKNGGVEPICVLAIGISLANCLVLSVYFSQRRALCRRCFLELEDVLNAAEEADRDKSMATDPDPVNDAGEAPRRSGRQRVSARLSVAGARASLMSRTSVFEQAENPAIKARASLIDVLGMLPRTSVFEQAEEPAQIRRYRQSLMLDSSGARVFFDDKTSGNVSAQRLSMLSDAQLSDGQEGYLAANRTSLQREVRCNEQNVIEADSPTADRGVLQILYSEMTTQQQHRVRVAMWCVVLSFYVTVLPISTNFGVLALYWMQVWEKDTDVSGMLMAVGELGGLITLMLLAQRQIFELGILKPFAKPMNLVCATLAASTMVAGIMLPSLPISALSSVGVHVINVLLHSFCAECAAAWAPCDVFTKWIGYCYMAKRFSNASIGFVTITVFLKCGPAWPFVMVSGTVATWSVVLFITFYYLSLLPFMHRSASPSPTPTPVAANEAPAPTLLGHVESTRTSEEDITGTKDPKQEGSTSSTDVHV